MRTSGQGRLERQGFSGGEKEVLQKYCQRYSLLLPRALVSYRKALDYMMTSFLKRNSPTRYIFFHRLVWACSEVLALPASPVLFSSTGVCNTDSLNINNSASPELVLRCPKVSSVTLGVSCNSQNQFTFSLFICLKKMHAISDVSLWQMCQGRRNWKIGVMERKQSQKKSYKLQKTENL